MKTTFYTRLFALVFGIVISTNVVAQKKDYTKELDLIFTSFQKMDYKTLEPLLDSDVKISDKIPTGMNDIVIPQVLVQLPIPSSYTTLSKETIGTSTKITTEYSYPSGKKRLQFFTFNQEGKVIELDILRDATKVEAEYRSK